LKRISSSGGGQTVVIGFATRPIAACAVLIAPRRSLVELVRWSIEPEVCMGAQRSALPQTAQLVRVLVLLITVVTLWPVPRPVFAQSGETGADIVEAVNRYRVEQGMPARAVHPALMVAAQRHAEWLAANHQGSHIGEGGSMPDDRAA